MRRHLHNLFFPHHGNNHKAKILHHSSLSKLVVIILCFQILLTGIARTNPGVLGYASDISVTKVLELTNANRQSGGLSTLSLNNTLSESARRKAQDMFAKNYWAHNAPDGATPWTFFKSVGYNYLYAGENLARDFGDSGAVVQAWMDSPTHRDNIMSGRYSEIGIAVVNGTLNGQETTLVVQHFGKPTSAAAAIPAQAAQAQTVPVKAELKTTPLASVKAEVPLQAVVETQNIPSIEQSSKPALAETYIPVGTVNNYPLVSALDLTKSVNIALSIIVIFVLALDGWLIFYKKTQRRSGKSFVHLSLFAMVILIIILTGSGKII